MKFLFFALSFVSFFYSNAQTIFLKEGRVEYEKKTNQHKALEDDEDSDSEWAKEFKKTLPKFVTDVYELHFKENKSAFHLKTENSDNKYLWGTKPSENDITVQDFSNNKLSIQRDIYEQTYLITDTVRKFEWKITGETREIAGFECKKAVTKICDSVYVVAFYTDQIMFSSGPESFGGLPGLILGLAVPRLSTTWFATKVETTAPTEKQLTPLQKGKKVNWFQINTDMKKVMKDWGKYGARRIWMYSL